MKIAMKINGQRLQTLRTKSGLSQKLLAAKAGVDPGTVSRWERAIIDRVRPDVFGRLRSVLGASEDDLRGDGPLPETKGPEREPEKGQMNLSIDAACRNALALVAHRCGVSRQQIVEAAPLLFFIAAEQSLKERRDRVRALREAADALLDIQPAHLPPHYPIDDEALGCEEQSIQARDLFGTKVVENEHVGFLLDPDWNEAKNNPFAVFLRDSLATVGGSTAFFGWDSGLSPDYRICVEEAAAFVGGDTKATEAILDGAAALHEVPAEIRKAGPAERAKWARGESDKRWENLHAMFSDPVTLLGEVDKVSRKLKASDDGVEP